MARYTQGQLEAARRAYASGVTRVTHDGMTTEYRSLAELRQIIADMEADLAPSLVTRPLAGFASFRRD